MKKTVVKKPDYELLSYRKYIREREKNRILSLLLAIFVLYSILITASIIADSTVYKTPEKEPSKTEATYTLSNLVIPTLIDEVDSENDEDKKTLQGTFLTTAYCACSKCCGQYADGYTATDTIATQGRTVAVDPDVIPLGSTVIINGNDYVAEDTGTAIKGNRIDIFFENHNEALQYGTREVEVTYEI